MSTTEAARTTPAVAPRRLVEPGLFAKLTARIAHEHDMPVQDAERIMEQALAFLYTCAATPGAALSPSPRVDTGWHAFLMYTRPYAEFCHNVAGRFIHHTPDEPGSGSPAEHAERIGATIAAMRAAGVPVDVDLWKAPAECSQCYAGCADDPAPVAGGNGYGGFEQ